VFTGLILNSCENTAETVNKKAFTSFEFSYASVLHPDIFSIKFTQTDTIYFRQHFSSLLSNLPTDKTTYFSMLKQSEKKKLDSFLNSIDFSKCDSIYYEDYVDGDEYQFYIKKDSIDKIIYVHSYGKVPIEITQLQQWIMSIKKQLLLKSIDTIMFFTSAQRFLLPAIPPPMIEFTPRK
jgi:hypothetical protein